MCILVLHKKQIRGLVGKMSNIELKAKLLATAKYLSIIETILATVGTVSIIKVIVISYIYMNNHFEKDIFSLTTKKNLFDKYLALLTAQKEEFLANLETIFDVILILVDSQVINLQDKVLFNNTGKKQITDKFLDKILSVSKSYSDSQVLREVLNYV